ncbi:MAG: DUF5666 domain-containing protein [Anaerolineae bacterium]|nr:DUF5666 domain-containing protein [Anaerolineae bacterium]
MRRWHSAGALRFLIAGFGLGVVALLFTAVVAHAASERKGDLPTWRGWVQARPTGTHIGAWVVGGRTFQADADTELDQEEGPLVVGACAKVKYQTVNGVDRAVEIDSEPPADCGGGGGGATATPTATPTGQPGGSPTATRTPTPTRTATPGAGEDVSVKARVNSMPAGGLIGTWVIGGVTYTTDANTVFRQDHGPFAVGVCVEVEYPSSNPSYAKKIATKSDDDCPPAGGGSSTPTPTRTATPGAGEDVSVKARVNSMPAGGLIGTWVIGGVTYTTDANTVFRQDHGPFAVGVCVEVEYPSSNPSYAKKIATKSDDDCPPAGGGSSTPTPTRTATPDSGRRQLYGVIESFPPGLIGTWQIGGLAFLADASTQFQQERAPFAVGVLVEVHFTTNAAGVNRALKIESKSAGSGGAPVGAEGHAFGTVETMPTGSLVGTWRIGGVDYTATTATRFEQNDGPLGIGAWVKVEYVQAASGARTAKKIETTSAGGNPTQPQRAKAYGFVQQRPAAGYVGTWVIGGVAYTADQNTRFDETRGLLAVGAYVEVEYVPGAVNRIYKLETHVPPGAGSDDRTGVIQQMGVNSRNLSGANAVWIVGGVSYQVLPATVLDDSRSPLTVGRTAVVNSYVDTHGQRVATQIRGVSLTRQLYLPMLFRRR